MHNMYNTLYIVCWCYIVVWIYVKRLSLHFIMIMVWVLYKSVTTNQIYNIQCIYVLIVYIHIYMYDIVYYM